jgi:hypothetical protein
MLLQGVVTQGAGQCVNTPIREAERQDNILINGCLVFDIIFIS